MVTEAEGPPWGQAEAGGPGARGLGQGQQSPCPGKSDSRAIPGSRLTVELGPAVAAAEMPLWPWDMQPGQPWKVKPLAWSCAGLRHI